MSPPCVPPLIVLVSPSLYLHSRSRLSASSSSSSSSWLPLEVQDPLHCCWAPGPQPMQARAREAWSSRAWSELAAVPPPWSVSHRCLELSEWMSKCWVYQCWIWKELQTVMLFDYIHKHNYRYVFSYWTCPPQWFCSSKQSDDLPAFFSIGLRIRFERRLLWKQHVCGEREWLSSQPPSRS